MMGWWGNSWGWSGAGAWWMFVMMLGWAAVIGLAVWGIARLTRPPRSSTADLESPQAILDRRFASGELDADGYTQARRVLERHSG